MIEKVLIYTDGACKNNKRDSENSIGGWGVYIRQFYTDGKIINIELFDGEAKTTNNRMEAMAVLQGLSNVNKNTKQILYTDSEYISKTFELKDGKICGRIIGWIKENWKTKKGERANRDLLEKIYKLVAERKDNLDIVWVRGHDTNEGNIKADELANKGCLR